MKKPNEAKCPIPPDGIEDSAVRAEWREACAVLCRVQAWRRSAARCQDEADALLDEAARRWNLSRENGWHGVKQGLEDMVVRLSLRLHEQEEQR